MRDSKDQYLLKVRQAQAEIHDGNSYEICLTTELSATAAAGADPLETYLSLRRRNPAPFANYLRFGSLTVASTSPERFMSLAADGALRAEPIKGTRRRVADPAADAALWRFLFDIDLTSRVVARGRPVDESWQFLVSDIRRCGPRLRDALYVRLVDVGAALVADGQAAVVNKR